MLVSLIVEAQAADHDDVVEAGRIGQAGRRSHIYAATGTDRLPRRGKRIPIREHPARFVEHIAGEAERIDEQREGRQCERLRQNEADPQFGT